MSQLWVKPPLSLPHHCRLQPIGMLYPPCRYLEDILGTKGASLQLNPILLYRLGLQEPSMLQVWPLAIEDGASPWTGSPPPCPAAARREQWSRQAHCYCQPLLSSPRGGSWPQHLSVTSRKEQPPNRTSTGTDRMDVPRHAHSHRDTRTGPGEQVHTHLLELLSLSLVFDVTPSAKQPERSLQKEPGQEARGHPAVTQH